MSLKDNGYLTFSEAAQRPIRRCRGSCEEDRLDGIVDLVTRARGASVFDIGCNRGLVAKLFADNGATRVMGCDIDRDCITVARNIFADRRATPHQFEVVDLTGGPRAVAEAFGGKRGAWKHDIVLLLATYHKLVRIMDEKPLHELMVYIGGLAEKFIGWRGYEVEMKPLDKAFGEAGLKRVHTSRLSDLEPAAIWARA